MNWQDEEERLIDFFEGSTWILQGYSGRWNGTHRGGYIFTDFMEMFQKEKCAELLGFAEGSSASPTKCKLEGRT